MTYTLRTPRPGLALLLLLVVACALPGLAQAQQENRLRRIAVRPHQEFTRITLFFLSPPDYSLRLSPGRVRLEIRGADAPSFRKLRGYADARLSGIFTELRAGVLSVSIPVRESEPGVQAVSYGNPSVLSLDIGPGVKRAGKVDIAPGREPILAGTEQFVRAFESDPGGVPFAPTDAKLLKELFAPEELALFQQGESLLYEEQAEGAAAVFTTFLGKPRGARALAFYRLGEALLGLGRVKEALDAFKKGEAAWPQYLEQATDIQQSYADALARSGDFAAGRRKLLQLMDRFVGTPYQSELMSRLADLSQRQGKKLAAAALYRSVIVHAPGSAAAARARLKLADRELFTLSRDRYRELLAKYQGIYQAPGDFATRDEALFKTALLLALYAPPREALEAAISYDRRYPRGIFSTIVKQMREELLLPSYRELAAAKNDEALVQLVRENREHLARCFSDPAFPERLSEAFERTGKLTQEMELFGYLDEKNWAAAGAPFMLSRVVDDAAVLGNQAQAEAVGRRFLQRFPADARAARVKEQLGRIAFEKGDLPAAGAELRFLAAKGGEAQFPDSDYYLGKAQEAAGDHRGAVRSLARFTQNVREDSVLLPDGYFTLAVALAALKDYAGALAACEVGGRVAAGESAAQFKYKAGELYLQQGEVAKAQASWEKAAASGGTWGKLAGESLSDLKWRMKISKELP